jgi:outer membrane protein W
MRPLKRIAVLAFVGLSWLAGSSRVLAEDTKGKWQFGFGLSYFATTDYIRSNADLAIASGVTGSCGEGALCPVGSTDDRPDINIMNQASIHDDFKLDFRASYGLTRWLAVEAAASYMNAPVGNIEFYNRNTTQGISAPNDTTTSGVNSACGPEAASLSHCWEWTPGAPDEVKRNTMLPVGTITEIPIHLSGLIRFRPESPLDPYIGLGFGYIMTNLKKGDEFNRTAALPLFSDPAAKVSVGDEGEYNINNRCLRENGGSCTNFHPGPLEANVKNAWEWHAVGGVDYYMSDHMSVYVDARYVWTSGSIDIRTDGAHQVRFGINDPGALMLQVQGKPGTTYNADDKSTWYLWEDIGVEANRHFHEAICPECKGDGFLETEDKNLSGAFDPQCPTAASPFCEDEGWLYQVPPGTRTLNRDALDQAVRIPCLACAHNNTFDTEDTNGNGYLDRYLVYGLDLCSTPEGVGNSRCSTTVPSHRYVWPQGCSQSPETLGPFQSLKESGCPPFLIPHTLPDPNDPTNPNKCLIDDVTQQCKLVYPSIGGTGSDDSADTIIIQGGRIRMGGFALGVGFKFTF